MALSLNLFSEVKTNNVFAINFVQFEELRENLSPIKSF